MNHQIVRFAFEAIALIFGLVSVLLLIAVVGLSMGI